MKTRKHQETPKCVHGTGKSLEEVIHDIDTYYDATIEKVNNAYDYLEKYPDRIEYTKHSYYIRRAFDKEDGSKILSREEVISSLNKAREEAERSKPYTFNRRTQFKDNQDYYNGGSGQGNYNYSVRVPSLKRSRRTWKRFYKLFPRFEEYSKNQSPTDKKLKKL